MNAKQKEVLEWFELMNACLKTLRPFELRELQRWEAKNIDKGTSSWPGWEKRIGKRPD